MKHIKVVTLSPEVLDLLAMAELNTPKQRADFDRVVPLSADMTAKFHSLENLRAPYTRLDDPIPLWPQAAKWMRKNIGKGDSFHYDATDACARCGNIYGVQTQAHLDPFKNKFG